ncbi:MAG: SagB/ThcOx family dehydrogenase [Methylobacter sp.]
MFIKSMHWPWLAGLLLYAVQPHAEENITIKLPPPRLEAPMPLMQALRNRHSTREFGTEKLSEQVLSDLLWAAFGVNRPDSGGRTAPSTRNWQDIDIYVATADGLYLYDAKNQVLKLLQRKDLRALTGIQDFVGIAPVNLVYVSDFTRMNEADSPEEHKIAAAIDAGFIGQNVYLYCAAAGFATVVRGSIDTEKLSKAMQLKPTQWIVAAQSVGHSKR